MRKAPDKITEVSDAFIELLDALEQVRKKNKKGYGLRIALFDGQTNTLFNSLAYYELVASEYGDPDYIEPILNFNGKHRVGFQVAPKVDNIPLLNAIPGLGQFAREEQNDVNKHKYEIRDMFSYWYDGKITGDQMIEYFNFIYKNYAPAALKACAQIQ